MSSYCIITFCGNVSVPCYISWLHANLSIYGLVNRILAHGAQELLVACSNGDIEMLDTLRMRGYDPITQTFLHNWTTLHEACQWGHLSIVKRLLAQNIHVNAKVGLIIGCKGLEYNTCMSV